jgi:hypothetical protein
MRRILLAAIPGFFGLMGLSQLREKKKAKGLLFLVAGIVSSILSSWYLLIPQRISELAFGSSFAASTSLFWLSRISGPIMGSEVSMLMLASVLMIWVFQVFDAAAISVMPAMPHAMLAQPKPIGGFTVGIRGLSLKARYTNNLKHLLWKK